MPQLQYLLRGISQGKKQGPVLIKHLWSSRQRVDLHIKIFFGALLSRWITGRYCFKRLLCGSWVWKFLWRWRTRRFLNKVYACGNRSAIHFQPRANHSPLPGSLPSPYLLHRAADPPRRLSRGNHIVHGSDPAGVFLFSSSFFSSHLNTLHDIVFQCLIRLWIPPWHCGSQMA